MSFHETMTIKNTCQKECQWLSGKKFGINREKWPDRTECETKWTNCQNIDQLLLPVEVFISKVQVFNQIRLLRIHNHYKTWVKLMTILPGVGSWLREIFSCLSSSGLVQIRLHYWTWAFVNDLISFPREASHEWSNHDLFFQITNRA